MSEVVQLTDRDAGVGAVLFDLYDTLVHASPDNSFYHRVPAALGVDRDRWHACYRALGRAAMLGEVPGMAKDPAR
jgi:hypothetical protein